MRATASRRGLFARAVLAILLCLTACLFLSSRAHAQYADSKLWDINGLAREFIVDGTTLYVGGNFTRANRVVGQFAVFDTASSDPETNWPMILGGPLGIAPDGAGGWYVVGSKTNVVSRSCQHVRADGTLDGWNPVLVGNAVAVAVGSGKIFLGGTFSSVNGQSRAGVAAFDSTTGQLLPWTATPMFSSVTALTVQGNTLYTAGSGSMQAWDATTGAPLPWSPPFLGTTDIRRIVAAGSAVYLCNGSHVVKLNATSGALIWDATPGGFIPFFSDLALGGGSLFVSGRFTSVSGQPRTNAAALDTLTGAVTTWNPNPSSDVATIEVSGETVYLGGSFVNIGGQSRHFAAAVHATTGSVLPWNPSPNEGMNRIRVSSGKVALGGSVTYGPGVPRNSLAAFDLTSGAPTAWNPNVNGAVNAMVRDGATLFVGGAFGSVGGVSRIGLAAIDLASGNPTPWTANCSAGGNVLTLALAGSVLYVGGGFNAVNATSRLNAAAVDAITGGVSGWAPQPNSFVRRVIPAGAQVYISGEFTNLNGITRRGIGAVDAFVGTPTSWDPNAAGAGSAVFDMVLRDNLVYAGGDFTTIGGQSRNRIAALSTTTGLANGWNPGAGGTVFWLGAEPGLVMAAGGFYTIAGQSRTGIAELDSVSGVPTPWDAKVEATVATPVNTFRRIGTDTYITGQMNNVGNYGAIWMARLLPRDTQFPTVEAATPANTELGDAVSLEWAASDDYAVRNIDLYLSRSGPAGPWEAIAIYAPPTGSYSWQSTGPGSSNCWLRVDARDFQGNVTSDISDDSFTLATGLGVEQPLSSRLELALPIPNPVAGKGLIAYALPRAGHVRMTLHDVQGRELQVLVDGEQPAGRHVATLRGDRVSPGVYFVRIAGLGDQRAQRVAIVR